MEKLNDIRPALNEEILLKKLHLKPGGSTALEFRKLLREWEKLARPKAVYDICFVTKREEERVEINGAGFKSAVLSRNLENVHRVFPYVATCGVEIDTAAVSGRDLLYTFWHETVKEAVLRVATTSLKRHIEENYRPGKLATMNPGASARGVWPIEQQKELFSLLGDVRGTSGVRLTESCLMIPNKSISGIFFPTVIGFENCAVCDRKNCEGRRAPYDPSMAAEWLKK